MITGVVCLVKDGINKSYYIKVLDLKVSDNFTYLFFSVNFNRMDNLLAWGYYGVFQQCVSVT